MWPRRLVVRISGSHPEDRGFESRRGHHEKRSSYGWAFFMVILAEWNPRSGYGQQISAQEFIPSTDVGVLLPASLIKRSSYGWAFFMVILAEWNPRSGYAVRNTLTDASI